MIDPAKPFFSKIRERWLPAEMEITPLLEDCATPNAIEPYYALLINPFMRRM